MDYEFAIRKAYAAFNKRDIPTLLSLLHPQVHWPNGWEGGYVDGHAAVEDYWTRQWREIDGTVLPVDITILPDQRVSVTVQQTVKDMSGKLLFDGKVIHEYIFEGNLVRSMEIKEHP